MMEVGGVIEKPRPAMSQIEETETMSETSSQLTGFAPGAGAGTYPQSGPASRAQAAQASGPGSAKARTVSGKGTPRQPGERPRVPDSTDYHNERRRYLARVRRSPGLRQRYIRKLLAYLLLRGAWSFGFFPVVLAFWIPLLLAEFNPVVMVQSLLPHLEAFVMSNPEVQARTISMLVSGWLSVGLFFFLFDVLINPFQSPFQKEADIHMRAWSQSQGLVPPDEM
ncbi:hypothetical protein GCM10007071_08610 [Marinobacter zhanjiangensis]|uniref:Uncharacterized protein n=1 Tax=Marinobacter zhanjiangensis TaxID=578215 RepID=A0ABQ3ARU2_9GAMM|nr:hypothetical protein GCM10007071_08610 [Marinobacter zhanjiangensis]